LLSNWHETGIVEPVHCPIEQKHAYSSRFTQNECEWHVPRQALAKGHLQSPGSDGSMGLHAFLIRISALATI
jgi:hypothetical protein